MTCGSVRMHEYTCETTQCILDLWQDGSMHHRSKSENALEILLRLVLHIDFLHYKKAGLWHPVDLHAAIDV